MKCLETRTRKDGLRHRRYRDRYGLTHRTVEVPLEVWNTINRQGRARNRLAEHARVVHRKGLRAQALLLIQEGWKIVDIAHELSVGVRTVQRWKRADTL